MYSLIASFPGISHVGISTSAVNPGLIQSNASTTAGRDYQSNFRDISAPSPGPVSARNGSAAKTRHTRNPHDGHPVRDITVLNTLLSPPGILVVSG